MIPLCPVCQEALGEGGVSARGTCVAACGHPYHRQCLDSWFKHKSNNTCPDCRKKAVPLHPLFLTGMEDHEVIGPILDRMERLQSDNDALRRENNRLLSVQKEATAVKLDNERLQQTIDDIRRNTLDALEQLTASLSTEPGSVQGHTKKRRLGSVGKTSSHRTGMGRPYVSVPSIPGPSRLQYVWSLRSRPSTSSVVDANAPSTLSPASTTSHIHEPQVGASTASPSLPTKARGSFTTPAESSDMTAPGPSAHLPSSTRLQETTQPRSAFFGAPVNDNTPGAATAPSLSTGFIALPEKPTTCTAQGSRASSTLGRATPSPLEQPALRGASTLAESIVPGRAPPLRMDSRLDATPRQPAYSPLSRRARTTARKTSGGRPPSFTAAKPGPPQRPHHGDSLANPTVLSDNSDDEMSYLPWDPWE